MNKLRINELENKINYNFKQQDILIEALTHSSYANEKKRSKYNERLEFLGDSVLGIIISDFLFKNYPELPEGDLTKTRAKIVCEPTLAECAKSIDIGQYLLLGRGEEVTGGRSRTSILADAFEAIIGAIYLDSDLYSAYEFVKFIMKDIIVDAVKGKIFIDYKTKLQEIIQNQGNNTLIYEIVNEDGPDHNKTFHTQVKMNNDIIGFGTGKSKKESEQNAAKMALRREVKFE